MKLVKSLLAAVFLSGVLATGAHATVPTTTANTSNVSYAAKRKACADEIACSIQLHKKKYGKCDKSTAQWYADNACKKHGFPPGSIQLNALLLALIAQLSVLVPLLERLLALLQNLPSGSF